MQYKEIPYVHLPLSRVVFGTYLPDIVAGKDAFSILDAAYSRGIQTFDTAAAYGCSEAVLGRWMQSRGNRSQVVLITKGANPNGETPRVTPTYIKMDLEQSFECLQTDYVDIYLLHRDDERVPVGEVAETLNAYHAAHQIGAFGASNWSYARIRALNEYCAQHGLVPFSVVSPSYSLADCIGDPWGGSVTLSGSQNQAYRDWLASNQMPVLTYSGLARGFLSGKVKSTDEAIVHTLLGPGAVEYGYPINFERLRRAEVLAAERHATVSQIALAWLFHQNINVFAITATSSPEHLESNLAALDILLSDSELQWLCPENCL